jgi:hypothetical protein
MVLLEPLMSSLVFLVFVLGAGRSFRGGGAVVTRSGFAVLSVLAQVVLILGVRGQLAGVVGRSRDDHGWL